MSACVSEKSLSPSSGKKNKIFEPQADSLQTMEPPSYFCPQKKRRAFL